MTRRQKTAAAAAMPTKMPRRAKSGSVPTALVDQEADDHAADDGTDEQTAESDEVTTAQPRAR